MNINVIRSDQIYKKMMGLSEKDKEAVFTEQLLKPFAFKWQCIGASLDAVSVIQAGGSYPPKDITKARAAEVKQLENEDFWKACEESITRTFTGFEERGIKLPVQDYVFTVLLNDPAHPMSAMTGDYCGDGGIPGYILGTIIPNEISLKMLPVALAHEANHNVRWQFIKWHPAINLADMIISEGLAEHFAAELFGEDKVGKWVSQTSEKTLETVIKPAIGKHLEEKNFNKISGYLYGDEIMKIRGQEKVGMPYCAGYACGYALISYFLKKTGKSIYEATITKTSEMIKETMDFWS